MKIKLLLTIVFLFLFNSLFSAKTNSNLGTELATVEGRVTDTQNKPLPGATVYVKNSTYGVSTNFEGKYFIELEPGNYTLVYSFIGFNNVEKEISVTKNQRLKLNASLNTSDAIIHEVEIVADKRNRAKSILEKTRNNRTRYLKNIKSYSSDSYVKTSIEKESFENDTIDRKERRENERKAKEKNQTIADYYKKENLNLIEYLAKTYFRAPGDYKENIIAYHDFSEQKRREGGRSVRMSGGGGHQHEEQRERERTSYMPTNPYIFYSGNSQGDFSFYRNLLDFSGLCRQPLKSPIGINSGLNYKFDFVESFFEKGKKINKIKVTPRLKSEALFYGNIFIQDSTWALVSVNLSVNEAALQMYKDFNIIVQYSEIEKDVFLPKKIEITYTIKDGKKNILGHTKLEHRNYIVNSEFDDNLFNNEIKTYEEDAFDRDSTFWTENRPVELKTTELQFISKSDSIKAYYTSDEYLDKQDSLFNVIDIWAPLTGIGYKNHYAGIEMHVGGLLEQIVPLGVGGYRHRLPFYIIKELKNGMELETRQQLDYGFNNKDFKGKVGLGMMYYPKKFVRTFVDVGNTYELINNFASFEQIFSRSNYVNQKSLDISQRIEIINGLYADLTLMYATQIPITDIQLSKWSAELFGELNKPIEFEEYTKSEIKLELKYRIGQKYVIKKNKKYIIGTDFPELALTYRKGIPELFSSTVNFDYLELGAKMDLKLARFGVSRGQAKIGGFLNKTNLRLLEHRYFRGSDVYFFSDPLMSFQLLGPTLSTPGAFFQANYIHHFDGVILNKMPLNRYLKLSLAGGGGTLSIPEQDFYHAELFAGIERVFRIKKQIFRFGLYAVTADNTASDANFTVKFGISYWKSYAKKWSY